MTRAMTKEDMRRWQARWREVEERERALLIATTYQERFAALALLVASADLFNRSALEEEDEVVRRRWMTLKNRQRGRHG